MLTIDGFGKDSGTGSLANASWSAEQVGVSKFATTDGIFERLHKGFLTYNGFEALWTILACTDYVIRHMKSIRVKELTSLTDF